jgi:hypothetical protein
MLFNEVNFSSQIFKSKLTNFDELAVELFRFQHEHNPVYRAYCEYLQLDYHSVNSAALIPFLPVEFFKTHEVKTGAFKETAVYTSSATTGMVQSRHFVKDTTLYYSSFLKAFGLFYGDPEKYAVLALLPSYLEREGSSLIVMAEELIQRSKRAESGFYLHNLDDLRKTILALKTQNIPVLLLGVTFALLDFAELHPMDLSGVIVMETGGMKGKRKEMVRAEVHETLQKAFNLEKIHSEYGMTELLSQAYSAGDGVFYTPPWMKIVVSDANDPLQVLPQHKTGLINVIDLANIHSCAFIQTADLGRILPGGGFEVLGRLDQSDVRGCSLMYL